MTNTIVEYFKDWTKVIDKGELFKVVNTLNVLYKQHPVNPEYKNIFKVFSLCPLNELKIVFLGQDPYPQKGVATGIAFGNDKDTKTLSPSLEVLKESCIDYSVAHYNVQFDNSLESWVKQGVLLLNSALTVEVGKPNSHSMLWRPFISKILSNICNYYTGIVYVLMGSQAQTFEPYINSKFNTIIKTKHPSFYARNNMSLPSKLFYDLNKMMIDKYNNPINWYLE